MQIALPYKHAGGVCNFFALILQIDADSFVLHENEHKCAFYGQLLPLGSDAPSPFLRNVVAARGRIWSVQSMPIFVF